MDSFCSVITFKQDLRFLLRIEKKKKKVLADRLTRFYYKMCSLFIIVFPHGGQFYLS